MAWYKILEDHSILPPFIKKVNAGGKQLCLVSDGRKIYALGSKCPHAGADLSTGWCENQKLICPFHRYSYSLVTGRGSEGQNDYIDTYPVEIRADGIYIEIHSFTDKLKQIINPKWTKKR